MKLHVKVTAENINEGEIGHAEQCPIAKALNGMGYKVRAFSWTIQIYDDLENGEPIWIAKTPKEAQNFMQDFDHEIGVAPFEFDLEFFAPGLVPA